ncbi:MAG: oxidoreductase [Bacteroidetes bacterium OLB12]|nr:MAG: oxidoreductase [Bacteroidetes bacterium OLB12]
MIFTIFEFESYVLNLIYPSSWNDYELLDSGNFEKLERFGKVILIRPEPQAIWQPVLTETDWKQKAHAHFTREQKDNFRFGDEVKGRLEKIKTIGRQLADNVPPCLCERNPAPGAYQFWPRGHFSRTRF